MRTCLNFEVRSGFDALGSLEFGGGCEWRQLRSRGEGSGDLEAFMLCLA
jgi:hypothetical protein